MNKNIKKLTFFCSFVVIALSIFYTNKLDLIYITLSIIYMLRYIKIRKERV